MSTIDITKPLRDQSDDRIGKIVRAWEEDKKLFIHRGGKWIMYNKAYGIPYLGDAMALADEVEPPTKLKDMKPSEIGEIYYAFFNNIPLKVYIRGEWKNRFYPNTPLSKDYAYKVDDDYVMHKSDFPGKIQKEV